MDKELLDAIKENTEAVKELTLGIDLLLANGVILQRDLDSDADNDDSLTYLDGTLIRD